MLRIESKQLEIPLKESKSCEEAESDDVSLYKRDSDDSKRKTKGRGPHRRIVSDTIEQPTAMIVEISSSAARANEQRTQNSKDSLHD